MTSGSSETFRLESQARVRWTSLETGLKTSPPEVKQQEETQKKEEL